MALVPTVQISPRGVRHRIRANPRFAQGGDGRVLVRSGNTQCYRPIRVLTVEVIDEIVEDSSGWCRRCEDHPYGALGLENLPDWSRESHSEREWALMVHDIRRAVNEAFPDRAQQLIDELLKRAPVAETPNEK